MLCSQDLTPPAALAGLTNLQHCYLQRNDDRGPGAGTAPPLPGGPWLRGLRWLGADLHTLSNSTAVLRAATALEFVEANEARSPVPFDWHSPPAVALFGWLTQHAPLAQVSFHGAYPFRAPNHAPAFDSRMFAARLMQLGRHRPHLQLRCSHSGLDLTPSLFDLVCE